MWLPRWCFNLAPLRPASARNASHPAPTPAPARLPAGVARGAMNRGSQVASLARNRLFDMALLARRTPRRSAGPAGARRPPGIHPRLGGDLARTSSRAPPPAPARLPCPTRAWAWTATPHHQATKDSGAVTPDALLEGDGVRALGQVAGGGTAPAAGQMECSRACLPTRATAASVAAPWSLSPKGPPLTRPTRRRAADLPPDGTARGPIHGVRALFPSSPREAPRSPRAAPTQSPAPRPEPRVMTPFRDTTHHSRSRVRSHDRISATTRHSSR